jgi:indole-3-glycerol phosphate synthase
MQTGFSRPTNSLCKNLLNSDFGIIAEHKRKSPSKSVINEKCLINKVIEGYSSAGVSGISILTDQKYFGGSIDDLVISRKNTTLPILRKEFIIDEYQIIEAKAIGADAILLIASCLKKETIKNLSKCAKKLDLEVLVEIHNLNELNNCLMDSVDIIGVNNRNLKTFVVDIQTSKELAKFIPKEFIKISESGISNKKEILELQQCGFNGFLIGENFMKEKNPGKEAFNFINDLKN